MGNELAAKPGIDSFTSKDMPPRPNYLDAGITNLVPAVFLHLSRSRGSLFGRSPAEIEELVFNINQPITPDLESWFPKEAREATQIVLLVLDGLGYSQFERYSAEMANLAGFSERQIASVAPTTTATALTSITTGATPSNHGILGYRMRMGDNSVMNTLTWACQSDVTLRMPDPEDVQRSVPFLNFRPKVVTKAQYQNSGFTKAHLRRTDIVNYRFPSTMIDHVSELLHRGEGFIYAYYEGIDTVAHEYGLGECYKEELRAVDYLIGRLVASLPKGASLLISADHGQVEVRRSPIVLDPRILDRTSFLSGEGRFRWIHAKEGEKGAVGSIAGDLYGDDAWVVTREQLVDEGYYGPVAHGGDKMSRLGDVALVAKSDVAFFDPVDTGPYQLVCRHGSLTYDELQVPLLSYLA